MAESGLTEEEVELDGGFCMELSIAERKELEITEHGGLVFAGARGDGSEMEAALGSARRGETKERRVEEMDDQLTPEEDAELDACLGPLEESAGLVRISLEEVERYSRFSRRCRWLCGRCWIISHLFLRSPPPSQFLLHLAVFTVSVDILLSWRQISHLLSEPVCSPALLSSRVLTERNHCIWYLSLLSLKSWAHSAVQLCLFSIIFPNFV